MKEILRKQNKKVKKKLKTRLACIGTLASARKVNLNKFILMKTVIVICMGRHEGIANVETYRDRQGQKRTDSDRQGRTRTSRDKHRQSGTTRDKQGQKGNVPACPCLVPALSLLWFCFVPACPCTVSGID